MAEYKNFFESSSAVKIEVADGGAGGTSNAYVSDFLVTLESVASTIVSKVNQFPTDQKPTEFQVDFGLKALGEGGFAICLGNETANFHILLKWGGGQEGLLGASSYPGEEGIPA